MRLTKAEEKLVKKSDIIRVDDLFECDNCSRKHYRTIRGSPAIRSEEPVVIKEVDDGGSLIISLNGANEPYVMSGLKGKKFCHEYCAVKYVIKQECG